MANRRKYMRLRRVDNVKNIRIKFAQEQVKIKKTSLKMSFYH